MKKKKEKNVRDAQCPERSPVFSGLRKVAQYGGQCPKDKSGFKSCSRCTPVMGPWASHFPSLLPLTLTERRWCLGKLNIYYVLSTIHSWPHHFIFPRSKEAGTKNVIQSSAEAKGILRECGEVTFSTECQKKDQPSGPPGSKPVCYATGEGDEVSSLGF